MRERFKEASFVISNVQWSVSRTCDTNVLKVLVRANDVGTREIVLSRGWNQNARCARSKRTCPQ